MTTQAIQQRIQELLDLLGVPYSSVEVIPDDEIQSDFFTIITDNPKLLLGRGAEALSALNYIVRKQYENEFGVEKMKENRLFFIDAGGYHSKRINNLKTKAKIMADRVRSFGADMELEPMPAYERLIIHSYLGSSDDVVTESKGVGRDRRIVIRYNPQEKIF